MTISHRITPELNLRECRREPVEDIIKTSAIYFRHIIPFQR